LIPLRDRNPTRRTPIVTFLLIGACFAVFALELSISVSGGDQALERFFEMWGAVPSKISAAIGSGSYLSQPMLGTITSQFLHGGWLHILGNMLFLWIFGANVEDAMGRWRFPLFYVAGGLAASALQIAIHPDATAPTIGASGAIAAVLGGYIVLYPRARVVTIVILIFFFTLIELPAWVMLGVWFAEQAIFAATSVGNAAVGGGVAYFAHVGGFAFGLVAVRLFARRVKQLPPAAGTPVLG
jgi:membrane associated rhomboid family serine protease